MTEQYFRVSLSILIGGQKEPFIVWEKTKNNYTTHYAFIRGGWMRVSLEHERFDMIPITKEEAERYVALEGVV